MSRGDTSSYTAKQKRMAQHIETSYESRGVSHDEAERRAWATVDKETGGGNKSGSGRGVADTTGSSRKGGRVGGGRRRAAERAIGCISPGRFPVTCCRRNRRAVDMVGDGRCTPCALPKAHSRRPRMCLSPFFDFPDRAEAAGDGRSWHGETWRNKRLALRQTAVAPRVRPMRRRLRATANLPLRAKLGRHCFQS